MIALDLLDPPEILYRSVWQRKLDVGGPFLGASVNGKSTLADGRLLFWSEYPVSNVAYGALDARTGRPIWRRFFGPDGGIRLIAGGGHLVGAGVDEILQIDARDGRTVWRIPTSPYGVGPFVVGDRLIAETTWGRLQAFDLRTHRALWTLQYPVEIGGQDRVGIARVVGNSMWAPDSDGNVIRVSLADGRLLSKRAFEGGSLRSLTSMRRAVLLCGEKATESWGLDNGKSLWRNAGSLPGGPFYASMCDELWTIRVGDGRLVRYRASDGARIPDSVEVDSRRGYRSRLLRYGGGYFVVTINGLVQLDAKGQPTGRSAAFLIPESVVIDGRDLLGSGYDGFTRFSPVLPRVQGSSVEEVRMLYSKDHLGFEDVAALGRLGHAAVPVILKALNRADQEFNAMLVAELMRVAEPWDTPAIFPLADASLAFEKDSSPISPFTEERPPPSMLYREWMTTKADPDFVAERLLPRLRTAADPQSQADLVAFMVRSRRPEIVAELHARLLGAWSSIEVRDAIYHGMAASGSPTAIGTVLALRQSGPVPTWSGGKPSSASTETERVLAAVFDARVRFWRAGSSSLNLAFGPKARPFALVGWAGDLNAVETPPLTHLGPTIRGPAPFVSFDPLDLDGTMVRFSEDGVKATARIGTSVAPYGSEEYEAHLQKNRGEWFVVSMTPTRK